MKWWTAWRPRFAGFARNWPAKRTAPLMQPSWAPALWYEANFCLMYSLFTLGFSLRTEGSGRMPRKGPVLVIANHESFIDPLLIGLGVRRQLAYLARKTLFKEGLFGAYLRSVGCIP